jgi:hypothetical protein
MTNVNKHPGDEPGRCGVLVLLLHLVQHQHHSINATRKGVYSGNLARIVQWCLLCPVVAQIDKSSGGDPFCATHTQ